VLPQPTEAYRALQLPLLRLRTAGQGEDDTHAQ
jgi:hypothetical protein